MQASKLSLLKERMALRLKKRKLKAERMTNPILDEFFFGLENEKNPTSNERKKEKKQKRKMNL